MTDNNHITGEAVLGGTTFFYEMSGEGHPLVLVHAGIADQRMWNDQMAAFAQRYRVIRYDMRGYGKTAMVAGMFSHHHDLHNLLQFLAIERAYLVGSSIGGSIIIDFALEHPEMVAALIPVASTPSGYESSENNDVPPDDAALKLQAEHEAAIERGDLSKAAEIEAMYWTVGLRRPIKQVDPALLARVHAMNSIALAQKVAALGSEQALEPAAIDRLHEIHAPTLVLNGDLDDPGILKGSELLASRIKNAQQAVIENTAHFPNMERPAAFNQLVLKFLASL